MDDRHIAEHDKLHSEEPGSILARAFIGSVNITNAAVAMITRHAAFPPDLPQLRNAADAAFSRPDILHTLNTVSLYKAHFDHREDQLLAAAVAAVRDGEPELPSDERTLYIHQTDDELEKQRYATEQLEKRFRPDYSDEDKHPSSVMDIFDMLTTNGLYERTDIPGGDKTIARMEKMVMASSTIRKDTGNSRSIHMIPPGMQAAFSSRRSAALVGPGS